MAPGAHAGSAEGSVQSFMRASIAMRSVFRGAVSCRAGAARAAARLASRAAARQHPEPRGARNRCPQPSVGGRRRRDTTTPAQEGDGIYTRTNGAGLASLSPAELDETFEDSGVTARLQRRRVAFALGLMATGQGENALAERLFLECVHVLGALGGARPKPG